MGANSYLSYPSRSGGYRAYGAFFRPLPVIFSIAMFQLSPSQRTQLRTHQEERKRRDVRTRGTANEEEPDLVWGK